jgi:hypothetical protein
MTDDRLVLSSFIFDLLSLIYVYLNRRGERGHGTGGRN